ncbi:MAG: TetR/AcrR family transcriptional regulator [Pseudomonadota bacterium]
MSLFWRKGYTDTSMAEIVAETGMNRYALYGRFGSKRDIFLAALEVYFEQGRQTFEPFMLDPTTPPIARLVRCLALMIEVMDREGTGCFICHVASQESGDDPEIAQAIADYFARIHGAMEITMCHARAAGVLNPALTTGQAAQLLLDAKLAMGVRVRAGLGTEALVQVANATLAALAAPGVLTEADRLSPDAIADAARANPPAKDPDRDPDRDPNQDPDQDADADPA